MNTVSRVLPIALLLVLASPKGCDESIREYQVEQPISFNHKAHVGYFKSGEHRDAYRKLHIKALEFDEEEAKTMVLTACALCHERGARPRCDGCHNPLLQDKTLFARKDIRVCVACHRGSWSGNVAGIPSITVCRDCHAAKALTDNPEEGKLRKHLSDHVDIPWVQLHRVPEYVHFSHSAHLRFAGMTCTDCHQDMTQRAVPPTAAALFSMDRCMQCHEQKDVSTDCLVCHQ